jgi:hypothetical protein
VFWAMGDPSPTDVPFTLAYGGYSPDVTSRSYVGSTLFGPIPLWLEALMEYRKRSGPIFEHVDTLGMPPEHLRAISSAVCE